MSTRIPVSTVVLALLLVALIAIPLAVRPASEAAQEGAERLVIITPHNQQIRWEFERGFSEWHEERYGSPVEIDYRRPGGTSEIRKQLIAIYESAVRRGDIGVDGSMAEGVTMPYDLCFGGGTYEHGELKRGVRVEADGEDVRVPISEQVDFDGQRLDELFGENVIGVLNLYDPDRHWFGVALSSFGILVNKDMLEALGLDVPSAWQDLTDPRYAEWLALGDPRLSGSVSTTYESILNMYGWDEGWRILRAMSANSRYFASDSKKVVLDVSRGEAAAGVAIDFYGRYQAQAVTPEGAGPEASRLRFVEPAGSVFVDPDPLSLLRGAPNRELAIRFIEYALTEHGQALWQMPATGEDAPQAELGPVRFELRRMPIRRVMYEKHTDAFIDKIQPFDDATRAEAKGWRSMIAPLFGAFAIDTHHEMKEAWKAMDRARSAGAPEETIQEMDRLFYEMPIHTMKDGTELRFNAENYRAIRNEWRDREGAARFKIRYAAFFRANYERIVEIAAGFGPA